MNVLYMDDHPLFRDALGRILGRWRDDLDVKLTAAAEEALEWLDLGLRPDLVLVDLYMPAMDGFDFLAALSARRLTPRVAVVTASERQHDMRRAWSAGVHGYVPKSYDADQMLAALIQIAAGQDHWPESFDAESAEAVPRLSPRQFQVLQLVSQGKSNDTIADTLCISKATVKFHVGTLNRLLVAQNRTELSHQAARLGIL